jgi:hypothetical protein
MAAMNGHVPAVKLLDMGSDINTQIKTKRNTAQTLACQRGALRQGESSHHRLNLTGNVIWARVKDIRNDVWC